MENDIFHCIVISEDFIVVIWFYLHGDSAFYIMYNLRDSKYHPKTTKPSITVTDANDVNLKERTLESLTVDVHLMLTIREQVQFYTRVNNYLDLHFKK